MEILIVVCIVLAIALIIAVIKIALLKRGYDELTDNIEDQVRGKTQIPVTLTTADPHARRTAETLNHELAKLQDLRNEYLDGNRKGAQAVTEISHDIRTPLTAINSYLDLMKDEENEALKQEYLERIKSRTLSLSDLADELFKYSTSTDPKCTSCNNDLRYYLAYDKPSSECYNKTTIDSGYILSAIQNETSGEITHGENN